MSYKNYDTNEIYNLYMTAHVSDKQRKQIKINISNSKNRAIYLPWWTINI